MSVSTVNSKEPLVHFSQYITEMKHLATPEELEQIETFNTIANRIEQKKTSIPNLEQIEKQVKQSLCKIETALLKQIDIISLHTTQISSLVQEKSEENNFLLRQVLDVAACQEFFQNQLSTRFEEFKNEMQINVHSPMNLAKDLHPSSDQVNGCLDGNTEIAKNSKNQPKKNKDSVSSTLHQKANDGDMNKNKHLKTAPNASAVPGSPELAKAKNKRDNIPKGLEENLFYADTTVKKTAIPTVITDPHTGQTSVKMEIKEYQAENDFLFQPSKSARKRMRKRKKNDAIRASCEIVIHNLEESIYDVKGELFWISEAKKFIKFTEEFSQVHLGEEEGIDLELGDIVKANRILSWTGKHDSNNPLPLVVQFKDELVTNAVKKAMFAAGCFHRRVHVKRGKFRRTGNKKTDLENAKIIKNLPYGRPSSTKAERELARKKKEYQASLDFQKKQTFQEYKQEREVDFALINEKYTIIDKDGSKDIIKKPKTSSKINKVEEPVLYFINDLVRVVCDFDGKEHEVKVIKPLGKPNMYKILVLGHGIKENKDCTFFKKSNGEEAKKLKLQFNKKREEDEKKSKEFLNQLSNELSNKDPNTAQGGKDINEEIGVKSKISIESSPKSETANLKDPVRKKEEVFDGKNDQAQVSENLNTKGDLSEINNSFSDNPAEDKGNESLESDSFLVATNYDEINELNHSGRIDTKIDNSHSQKGLSNDKIGIENDQAIQLTDFEQSELELEYFSGQEDQDLDITEEIINDKTINFKHDGSDVDIDSDFKTLPEAEKLVRENYVSGLHSPNLNISQYELSAFENQINSNQTPVSSRSTNQYLDKVCVNAAENIL